MSSKKTSGVGKAAAGLGLAALAAGAAATYFFSGSEGKKHQQQAQALGKKAKTEMLHRIKQMKSVSKKTYDQAAKEVLAKYKQVKNIDPGELTALGKELKGHWDSISKTLDKAAKAGLKAMPKKSPSKTKKRARK